MANIHASGATVFPGMPVFYQAFLELAEVPALPQLRLCISAGSTAFNESGETIPGKIRAAHPFVLRLFRVRRHLLRPRRQR